MKGIGPTGTRALAIHQLASLHLTKEEFFLFLTYVYGWLSARMTEKDLDEFEEELAHIGVVFQHARQRLMV